MIPVVTARLLWAGVGIATPKTAFAEVAIIRGGHVGSVVEEDKKEIWPSRLVWVIFSMEGKGKRGERGEKVSFGHYTTSNIQRIDPHLTSEQLIHICKRLHPEFDIA